MIKLYSRNSPKLLILWIFIIASQTLVGQTSNRPIQLRILSYNIFHGETMRGDFNLDLIADVIKKADPDLVALQEVDFRTNRAKGMDLVLELAERTKMYPLFGRAMDYDGGAYGEGILSKFPIEASELYPLDATAGHEPRAALMIRVNVETDQQIAFIATHLDHTRDPSNRITQTIQLNTILRDVRIPVLLAGDLNALPGSHPIEILKDNWTMADQEKLAPTFPSQDPDRKIDYVFYYPKKRWRVIETKVIIEEEASDHCPYLVIIELLPE